LAWSLSIDASSDICDWEQLVLWVTFSSIGKTSGKLEVSKKFLTMLTLADRTRGKDIFDAVKKFCLQNDLLFSIFFLHAQMVALRCSGLQSDFVHCFLDT
jgi:hypothetical protein